MSEKIIKVNPAHLRFFTLFILMCILTLSAQHASAGVEPINGFMDTIFSKVTSKNEIYTSVFKPVALSLLTGLSVIELAFDTGTRMLKESSSGKLIAYIVVRVSMLAIVANFIDNPDWIKSATDLAYTLGGNAGGVSKSITPSSVAGMGVMIFNAIMVKIKMDIGALNILTNPQLIIYGLIIIVVGLAVIILFVLIGLLFLVTKVESTMVISIGIIMLGFLGSSWTSQWGKSYFSYILAVCIKLIVMLVMLGVVQDVTSSWGNQIADAGKDFDKLLDTLIYVATCSIVLLWLVMNIPSMAAGIVSGVSTAGLSSLMAAGTAGAAAGMALVAGAASFLNGAKNSIQGQSGSIQGMSGGGEGGSGSGSEQMGPSAEQPPSPSSPSDGGGATPESSSPPSEGGSISSGNDAPANSSTGDGSAEKKSDTSRQDSAARNASAAHRNLQASEGQTSVAPPQAGGKHIDI